MCQTFSYSRYVGLRLNSLALFFGFVFTGHTRQGLKCRVCKLNVHVDCQEKMGRCQPKSRLLRRQKSTSEIETRIQEPMPDEESEYALCIHKTAFWGNSQSLCVEFQASDLRIICIFKILLILCKRKEFHIISVSLSLLRRPGFNPREVRVRFVVNGVSLGKVNLQISLTNYHSTIVPLSCYLRLRPNYQRTQTQPQGKKNIHVRVFASPPPPVKFLKKLYIFFWCRSEYETTVESQKFMKWLVNYTSVMCSILWGILHVYDVSAVCSIPSVSSFVITISTYLFILMKWW
jgi:hypothetical protein